MEGKEPTAVTEPDFVEYRVGNTRRVIWHLPVVGFHGASCRIFRHGFHSWGDVAPFDNGPPHMDRAGCEGDKRLLKFDVCWDAAVCAVNAGGFFCALHGVREANGCRPVFWPDPLEFLRA